LFRSFFILFVTRSARVILPGSLQVIILSRIFVGGDSNLHVQLYYNKENRKMQEKFKIILKNM